MPKKAALYPIDALVRVVSHRHSHYAPLGAVGKVTEHYHDTYMIVEYPPGLRLASAPGGKATEQTEPWTQFMVVGDVEPYVEVEDTEAEVWDE